MFGIRRFANYNKKKSEACSEPCQTSTMKLSCEIVIGWNALTIFAKSIKDKKQIIQTSRSNKTLAFRTEVILMNFCWPKSIKFNESQYKQCGITPHFPPGKIYLKRYWEEINTDATNWEKLFDRSADHKYYNIPWLITFN